MIHCLKYTKRLHLRTWISLGIILILSPIILYATFRPAGTSAEWWNESWIYRKRIDISNPGGTDLTDFQVSFTLDTTDTNKFQSNCEDLRITGVDGNLLPFWIEENNPGCGDANTKVWVKLPSIPSSGTYIYAYYGNTSASVSSDHDGKKVFEFFDDFSGTLLNTTKWQKINGGTPVFSNGTLTITTTINPGKLIALTAPQGDNYILRARFQATAGTSSDERAGVAIKTDTSNGRSYNYVLHDFINLNKIQFLDDSVAWDTSNYGSWLKNTYYTAEIYHDGTNVYGRTNDGTWNSQTWSGRTGYPALNFGSYSGTTTVWDFALVRKAASTEPTTSVQSEEIGPGPIAYWKFDEGTGQTANDSTSNANHGTLGATSNSESSDPTWKSEDQCISGKCLQFDGIDDETTHGDILDDTITNNFSISMWFRNNGYSNDWIDYMLFKASISNAGIPEVGIGIVAAANTSNIGKIQVRDHTDGTYLMSSKTYNDNLWHHLTFVYNSDDTQGFLYIDGTQVANSINAMSITTGNSFVVGGRASTGRNFKGFLDEVKIYPYARSADQIKADYNRYANVLGAKDQSWLSNGLVGYWSMDESSGTTVTDKSGNGNDGTLTNAQETGTAEAASTTTTVVDADNATLSSSDDTYNGMILRITGGSCGITSGTERVISDYTGSSKTITVGTAFSAEPDDCTFEIRHQVGGKFGNAVSFSNQDQNDKITIPSSSSLNLNTNYTFSAWIKPKSYGNGSNETTIMIIRSNADAMLRLTTTGRLHGFAYDASGGNWPLYDIWGSTQIPTNEWTHVSFTVNNTSLNLYINGVLDKSEEISSTYTNSTPSTSYLGWFRDYSPQYGFDGLIDEVRIYNRTLSTAEVADLYNWAPGPVGYWKFEETPGSSTVIDSSGYNKNGTPYNLSSSSWVTGKFGKALRLIENSDQYVNLGTILSGASSYTYTFWFNPSKDADNSSEGLVGQSNAPRVTWGTSSNPVYPRASFGLTYPNGSWAGGIESTNLASNNWYHVTAVMSDSGSTSPYAELYINGIKVGSKSWTQELLRPTGYHYINYRDGYKYFDGIIDEVKIYNYARTPEQIRQDMAGQSVGGGIGDPLPQPIAHWSFDEQSGQTAYNKSSSITSNINGTLGANTNAGTDDPTWKTETDCKVNGCLSFDGSNDYVTLVDDPLDMDMHDFTITTWINATNSPAQPFFIDKRRTWSQTTAGYTLLANTNGYIELRLADGVDGPYSFVGNSNILDNNWHHLAAIVNRSKSIVKLYVDGKLEGSQTINSALDSLNNSNVVRLGTKDLSTTNALNGKIDEVKIYNFALSDEQIYLDYNAGKAMTFGSVSEASEADDLADGAGDPPIAEWKFDEKTGTTAYDTSGNGNNGSITGATWTSGCKQGGCLSFDGNDYVSVPNFTGLNNTSFTLQGWIYVRNQPSYYSSMVLSSGSGFVLYINQTNRNPHAQLYNGTGWTAASCNEINTPLNSWHHLALTYDDSSTSMTLYYNGQKCSGPINISGGFYDSYNTTIQIGAYLANYFHDGLVDHVKIYNYARTPAQIAYDYNRGAPIGLWNFDECQGSTIHDTSGNGNNGTLTVTTTGGNSAGIGTCNTTSSAWGSGASGKFGASLNFDGDGDYVNLGDTFNFDSLKPFSMSAWIKRQAGGITIMGKYGGQTRFSLDASGTLQFTRGNETIESSYNLNTNQWYLVTTTYDGTNLRMYVDGKNVSNPIASGSISSSSTPFLIGAQYNTGSISHYFNGQIDDVRIYNYALSAAQVKKLYNGGFSTYFGP